MSQPPGPSHAGPPADPPPEHPPPGLGPSAPSRGFAGDFVGRDFAASERPDDFTWAEAVFFDVDGSYAPHTAEDRAALLGGRGSHRALDTPAPARTGVSPVGGSNGAAGRGPSGNGGVPANGRGGAGVTVVPGDALGGEPTAEVDMVAVAGAAGAPASGAGPSGAPEQAAADPPRPAAATTDPDRSASTRVQAARARLRLRHRIFPRTVIGITMLLLAAAVGASFSGALLYAYYDWRLGQNEDQVAGLVSGFEQRATDALTAIAASTEEATGQIRTELAPLQYLVGESNTIAQLAGRLSPSVWFVTTLDEEGRSSVGSAFVVASNDDRSLLLTSYDTVAAATQLPAPEVHVRKGDEDLLAQVWSWQPERDLALLVVERGGMEVLGWATEEAQAAAIGSRIYVVSGLGGVGAALSPGHVIDQSTAGLQHTAAVGAAFQGGPLVTADGRVLGIASRTYAPLGFDPGAVPFAAPVRAACEQLLSCGDGVPGDDEGGATQGQPGAGPEATAPGAEGAPATTAPADGTAPPAGSEPVGDDPADG